MKMFSRKWWQTTPDRDDLFFCNIRETYQTLRRMFVKDCKDGK